MEKSCASGAAPASNVCSVAIAMPSEPASARKAWSSAAPYASVVATTATRLALKRLVSTSAIATAWKSSDGGARAKYSVPSEREALVDAGEICGTWLGAVSSVAAADASERHAPTMAETPAPPKLCSSASVDCCATAASRRESASATSICVLGSRSSATPSDLSLISPTARRKDATRASPAASDDDASAVE